MYALEQAGEDEWRWQVQAMNPWPTICTIQDSRIAVPEEKVREVVGIIDGGSAALKEELKGHDIAQVKEKLLSLQVRAGVAIRQVHIPIVARTRCE